MIERWIAGLMLCVVVVACDGKTVTPEEATAPSPAETDASTQNPTEAPAGGEDAAEGAEVDEVVGPAEPTSPEREAEPTIADAEGDRSEPAPKTRPTAAFPPPTEAEFKAWDRKDPAGDKALYEWDRDHLDLLVGYLGDLQCFRHRMRAAGQAHLDGKSSEREWSKAKQQLIPAINRWQQQLFADNPRILEKSKILGTMLEAHELVMRSYPMAYDDGGGIELDKVEAHWVIIQAKARKYVEKIGGSYDELSVAECSKRETK